MAAGLTGGIVLGTCWPGYAWLVWPVFLISAAVVMADILRRRPALIWPLIFIAAAGYLSVQPWLAPHLPDQYVRFYTDQGKWEIQGVVADEPHAGHDRLRFILRARQLTGKARAIPVCGYLQITARLPAPTLTKGDPVRLWAHIRSVRNFSNPGGFDYERFMALQGVFARAFADKRGLQILPGGNCPVGFDLPGRLRRFLSGRMDRALGGRPEDSRQLLKALTLGDRSGLSDQVRNDFARTGVGHLLAISGLHIGIVALCAYGLAMRLLACWP